MRANVGVEAGAVATVAVSVAFAAGWLWVSMKLPAPAVSWKAFLPGGILLAVGFTALHIFTVYYLGEKLARSSGSTARSAWPRPCSSTSSSSAAASSGRPS